MKKDKIIISIIIALISALLFCVMFMQFKVVNETDIAQIEYMRTEELEEALEEWKEKYQLTYEKLEETSRRANEYDEKINSNEEAAELVENELKEANILLGNTDVAGSGVEIILEDNQNAQYSAYDLLELVNELKAAGAEAISINDERIINLTDIVDISNRIKVNSKYISSPYKILAIGDKTYLESALNLKNGYVDLKTKKEYSISVQARNNIKINKYTKSISLNYIDN